MSPAEFFSQASRVLGRDSPTITIQHSNKFGMKPFFSHKVIYGANSTMGVSVRGPRTV